MSSFSNENYFHFLPFIYRSVTNRCFFQAFLWRAHFKASSDLQLQRQWIRVSNSMKIGHKNGEKLTQCSKSVHKSSIVYSNCINCQQLLIQASSKCFFQKFSKNSRQIFFIKTYHCYLHHSFLKNQAKRYLNPINTIVPIMKKQSLQLINYIYQFTYIVYI